MQRADKVLTLTRRLREPELPLTGQEKTMKLTAQQEVIFAEFIADYNGGEASDYIGDGGPTRDEFARYDGEAWNDFTGQEYETRGGFPCVHYDSAQAIKGSPRVSLWVMDCGDFRWVFQM
jgi:hypothetical protein